MAENAPGQQIAVGAIVALIVLMIVVLAALVGGALVSALGGSQFEVAQADPEPGQTQAFNVSRQSIPGETHAYYTTENGLVFPSGESYVNGSESGAVERGPWTLCAYVELNESANLNATYDVAAAAGGNIQLEYDAGDWSVYYDNGSIDGKATADAPTATDPHTLCGRFNGSHLGIFRNGTEIGTGTLDAGITSRNVSIDFHGRIDEVRVSNSSIAQSKLQTYANRPAIPLDKTNPAARYMFDEGSGSTSEIYYSSDTATLFNVSWGAGVPAAAEISIGGNFRYSSGPWGIEATAGGELDNAPVVYVYYANPNTFSHAIDSIVASAEAAIVLLSVLLIVIPVIAVILLVVTLSDRTEGFRTSFDR